VRWRWCCLTLSRINACIASTTASSAVFTGRLSLACQPTEVDVVRSGYCGVRASVPSDLMLHGYEGISMRVMTDGREYVGLQMRRAGCANLMIVRCAADTV